MDYIHEKFMSECVLCPFSGVCCRCGYSVSMRIKDPTEVEPDPTLEAENQTLNTGSGSDQMK